MKDNFELRKKEHEAVRHNVGYYDFTHQLLNVTGSDSAKFLDRMFVNDIKGLKLSHALYTTMLNREAEIIDDVIVFHLEEDRYLISTLYIDKMIKWFDEHKKEEDVNYEDITDRLTMYAVQGPKSRDLINSFVDENIDDLAFFTVMDNTVGDLDIMIARAGFTGELGYELYVPSEKKEELENKLIEKGKEFNLVNITSDVIITSLPAEKGYVLMSDLEGANPLEVGYGWTVDWNSFFIGKNSLEKAKKKGITRDLLGFVVEDSEAEIEPGDKVEFNSEEVGKVTKFTYSFSLGKNIGYALVDTSKVKKTNTVKIKSAKAVYDAKLCQRIFYDLNNERVNA